MKNENLTNTIREYKEWKQIQEEAAARMEELKNLITSEMDAQGLDKMNVDVFTIKNITVTSQRFDSTTFQKNNEQLYNQYLKQSSYKRFSIS